MDPTRTLDRTIALLGGELADATGGTLTPASAPVSLVSLDTAGRAAATAAIAAGRRALVAVPLVGSGAAGRLRAVLSARLATRRARRMLAGAGATRIRTLAVVPGSDALFLVYELGPSIQAYVEDKVILEPPHVAPHVRLVKAALAAVAGVATGVDLVVVVGERA